MDGSVSEKARKFFADGDVTLGRRGSREVAVACDSAEAAEAIFEWLETLGPPKEIGYSDEALERAADHKSLFSDKLLEAARNQVKHRGGDTVTVEDIDAALTVITESGGWGD